MSHMDLWNRVSKTDPKHTKKVEFGRKFTAIDAHYQVMKATEEFGPVGEGWGYDCVHGIHDTGTSTIAWCDVTIWWDKRTHDTYMKQFGPVRGMATLVSDKGRTDEDAGKKAMTDALTKGLSHLGFSADVFLGLFDDNKYVAERKREEAAGSKADNDMAWAVKIIAKFSAAKSLAALDEMWLKLEPLLDGRDKAAVDKITADYKLMKETLKDENS